ncbi:MAG: hypothetical protein SFU55_01215 [Methylophilus sp.]|nr:hypothetical protein [Methylophilus sp.]
MGRLMGYSLVREGVARYLVVLAFCVANVNTLSAMEFIKDFYLPLTTNYDSNIQMVNSNEKSVVTYAASPRLVLIAQDDLNRINLDAMMLLQKSSDRRISADRDDPSLSLGWQRDFSRGQLLLTSGYSKSSTRTTELNRSGLVAADGSSISKSVNLGLNYLLTDRYTLSTGLGYQSQDYTSIGLIDYTSKTISAKLSYLYSPTLAPFIQTSLNRYEETGVTSGSRNSKSTSAGFNYQANDKLNMVASAGVNQISSGGRGWIGAFSLGYLLDDRSSINASIARTVSPSGLGGFEKADSMFVNYTHELSAKDRVGADFGWNINRSINESRNKQFSAWYRREISQDWSLRANTQYRTLENGVQQADGYLVGLSVEFQYPNF